MFSLCLSVEDAGHFVDDSPLSGASDSLLAAAEGEPGSDGLRHSSRLPGAGYGQVDLHGFQRDLQSLRMLADTAPWLQDRLEFYIITRRSRIGWVLPCSLYQGCRAGTVRSRPFFLLGDGGGESEPQGK